MTADEEHYLHYVECISSLNRAWSTFQELKSSDTKGIIYAAAYRFALIEYAKPYTRSDGIHKKGRNAYRLIPPELDVFDLQLHQQILDLRDQVLAHSDLTLREAILYVARFHEHNIVTIASDSLAALPKLDRVVSLIEHTLEQMYLERTRLEEALPLSELA